MIMRPSLAVVFLIAGALPAAPKGSAVIHDDPYNPHHIDRLPAEVQQYIAKICKGPASAKHDFCNLFTSRKALADKS